MGGICICLCELHPREPHAFVSHGHAHFPLGGLCDVCLWFLLLASIGFPFSASPASSAFGPNTLESCPWD